MSDNRVLRRIFGPKREEMAGGWRRLHNEELHNLYASPRTIRVIKSRRMRWAGHIAHTGEMRNTYNILAGKPEGKRTLGIPKCRLEYYRAPRRNRVESCGLDASDSGQGQLAGSYERGNEPSGSIKGGEFVE
jgi:hypothetical protein